MATAPSAILVQLPPMACEGCNVLFFQACAFDQLELNSILKSHGVVKSVVNCARCGAECHLDFGLEFRCQKVVRDRVKKQKGKPCNWRVSGRVGSFIEKSKLDVAKIWRILITFLFLKPPRQSFLSTNLKVTQAAVVDWYSFIREVYIDHLQRTSQQIGGPNQIVEIDEAKFGKRKYNRGRIVEGQWVLGGIQRYSKKAFLVPVKDRTSRTLVRFIRRWVLPGSVIVTDCWRAYNCLSQYQFSHYTVNHSKNFVDPVTRAHTNNVERKWRDVRASIPKYGVRKEHFVGYLAEYLFKQKYDETDRVCKFLQAAAELYPPKYQ